MARIREVLCNPAVDNFRGCIMATSAGARLLGPVSRSDFVQDTLETASWYPPIPDDVPHRFAVCGTSREPENAEMLAPHNSQQVSGAYTLKLNLSAGKIPYGHPFERGRDQYRNTAIQRRQPSRRQ